MPFTIFNYKLGSDYIDYTSSQEDLGVTITEKMLWNSHQNSLLAKATNNLCLLMRTCHFTINVRQKRAFYLVIIRSLFEHCSVVWRPCSPNQISKFEVIQKRAIKWIIGRPYDHISDMELYNKEKELDILPVKFKFVFNDLVMIFKVVNSLTPIQIPQEFFIVTPEKVRHTRSTQNIINHNDKTMYKCEINPCVKSYENCFFYRAFSLWNRLPFDLRQVPSLSVFRVKLTEFLWSVELSWPG